MIVSTILAEKMTTISTHVYIVMFARIATCGTLFICSHTINLNPALTALQVLLYDAALYKNAIPHNMINATRIHSLNRYITNPTPARINSITSNFPNASISFCLIFSSIFCYNYFAFGIHLYERENIPIANIHKRFYFISSFMDFLYGVIGFVNLFRYITVTSHLIAYISIYNSL